MENTEMGMFKVKATVANPKDPKKYFEEDFWVDTGSLYTFIPEDRLEEIGIEPSRTREFTLADGRRDRRLLGEALITIRDLNETATNPVVFGPRDSLYLIGAVTLETFAVEVDPATRALKPITAIIGAHRDTR